MSPSTHIISSASLGVILWFFTKSLPAGILAFVSGVFMDIDHIIEYIIHHDRESFSFANVFRACEETVRQEGELKFEKLYLVFHMGEIAVLLWVAAICTKSLYLFAISLGYTLHLTLDSIGNRMRPFSYFFLVRLAKNFGTNRLFKK